MATGQWAIDLRDIMVAPAAHIVSSMILFNDNDDLEQGLTTGSLSEAYLIVGHSQGVSLSYVSVRTVISFWILLRIHFIINLILSDLWF